MHTASAERPSNRDGYQETRGADCILSVAADHAEIRDQLTLARRNYAGTWLGDGRLFRQFQDLEAAEPCHTNVLPRHDCTFILRARRHRRRIGVRVSRIRSF